MIKTASSRAESQKIASALHKNRARIAEAIFTPIAASREGSGEVEADGGLKRHLELRYHDFVQLLALYFKSANSTYRDLYIGEMLLRLRGKGEDAFSQVLQEISRQIAISLEGELGGGERVLLSRELADIAHVLTSRSKTHLKILMVGDCLHRDVASFLIPSALADGITVDPVFLNIKNPAELRNELGRLSDQEFDLAFYSPFTYALSPEFLQTQALKFAFASPSRLRNAVDSAFQEVSKTLDVISELFECPIIVHNSAHLRKHDGSPGALAKNLLTGLSRKRARDRAHQLLVDHVARRNSATYEHIFVLDETRFVREEGELRLGRAIYKSEALQPIRLAKRIAEEYRDFLFARALLLKKKLIVCDLDNTLWEGVIGEGAVRHHLDKQRLLKELKSRGIVLAICSKNDPKNVHWKGGTLSDEEFVSTQISWDPKPISVKRIEKELNLKAKDFVFIDDRADERAMVADACPGLLALDPLDERTWRLFEIWLRLAPPADEDRTLFYKQRELRQDFLDSGGQEDPATMFGQLGLEVTLRLAKKSDLKRVAELINRTNQFNTCGSRTTYREVSEWHSSGSRQIWVVDAKDKFGSMGTISIAVAHELPDRIEIPIFVLSCRVFGYRIEDAVLNAIKRRAARNGLPVIGLFRATPHNEPCHKVYPSNGFSWDGTAWTFPGLATAAAPAIESDLSWLNIRDEAG